VVKQWQSARQHDFLFSSMTSTGALVAAWSQQDKPTPWQHSLLPAQHDATASAAPHSYYAL
jgi:hypothetical protein